MQAYQVYGFRIASGLALTESETQIQGDPDFVVSYSVCKNNLNNRILGMNLVYQSPHKLMDGRTWLNVYASGDQISFQFTDVGLFCLRGQQVEVIAEESVNPESTRAYFLSFVLPTCLEQNGYLVLHASSAARKGYADIFIGNSGFGKSSLAAALVQRGWELVGDDIVAVHLTESGAKIFPAPSKLRLWPDAIQNLWTHQDLPITQLIDPKSEKSWLLGSAWQNQGEQPYPLNRIFILGKANSEENQILICPSRPAQATIELIKNSFVTQIVDALGLAPRRLGTISRLVEQVPILNLCYPRKFEFLNQVCAALDGELEHKERTFSSDFCD